MTDVPARITELELLVETLDDQLSALPSGDRGLLAAAVATARAAISDGPVPCPEAMAIAEVWNSLGQRLVGLESRMEAGGGGTEAVAARLDDARAAARRAAEEAAVARTVMPDEAARLEELHDRLIDTEQRTSRGLRRGAARKDFELARADLNDALDEIGYPTWAVFRMGNGLASVSASVLERYERSQAQLSEAEAEWSDLMARLEADTDLQEVLAAIDATLDQGIALLEDDPYAAAEDDDPAILTEALQARLIDARTVGVDQADALSHLRTVLDQVASIGHQDLTADVGLVALGDTWLRVLAAADETAVRILRDRERAVAELKSLVLLGDGSRVDRLDAERAAVRVVERDVAETRDCLNELTRVRMELHMLAATELAVAEEHDAKLQFLEGAKVLERLAEHRLNNAADGPRGVESVASRIPCGAAGAIPLVVLMGDAPIESLDALLGLPDDVQAIVLGDTDGIAEWAARQEYDMVDCVDTPALV